MKYFLLVILFAIVPIDQGQENFQFDKKVITLERRMSIIEKRIIAIDKKVYE